MADLVQHLVEVVPHQAIAGPLQEERQRDDDTQRLRVPGCRKEGLPLNICVDGAVEHNGCLDLIELVSRGAVFLVAVCVVVDHGLRACRKSRQPGLRLIFLKSRKRGREGTHVESLRIARAPIR